MTTRCIAIVENGVLRPKMPLGLKDGTEVEVLIHSPDGGATGQDAATTLAAIAALPMETGGKEFAGRDHDQILYGSKDCP
ncbi:MAG: antitoxin family protein [Planctomycetes bacterium]|nr:antitoxin family protein [Planctomycetota bacterium]